VRQEDRGSPDRTPMKTEVRRRRRNMFDAAGVPLIGLDAICLILGRSEKPTLYSIYFFINNCNVM